jgi:phosphatidylserine synthase
MLLALISLLAAYVPPIMILLAVFILALLMVSNFKVPKIK